MKNDAISEIIGSITLIAIIGTATLIFASLYLPTIQTHPTPKVMLIIGCDDYDMIANIDDRVFFPCKEGVFMCPANIDTLLRNCQEDCVRRISTYKKTTKRDAEYFKCLDACDEHCGNYLNCNFLYICHIDGEDIELSRLKIFVNGVEINEDRWHLNAPRIDNFPDNFFQLTNNFANVPLNKKFFSVGDTLMVNLGNAFIVTDISIIYSSPFGGEYVLTQNLYRH